MGEYVITLFPEAYTKVRPLKPSFLSHEGNMNTVGGGAGGGGEGGYATHYIARRRVTAG